jgi:predicted TIM-barrel fold metal-dependent hydrolase
MQKVIDVRLDAPLTTDELAENMKFFILNNDGNGLANYRHIFGERWANSLGSSFAELEKKGTELPDREFKSFLMKLAEKITLTSSQYESQLDEAGIEWGLIDDVDIKKTIGRISHMPERYKGMIVFNPFIDVNEALNEIEQAVKISGFKAIYANPFKWGIEATDPRFSPCYAEALSLDVPVFIYTAMSYNTDLPMEIGHPRNLDKVARDFPNLKIVASCGGWPWVPELIGVARRHRNIYIDTSSHRPKYLPVSGSGFEMLIQFGNTLLQDQIVFGSGVGELALPITQIVDEMKALPLKDNVKAKWLYENALQLFNLN